MDGQPAQPSGQLIVNDRQTDYWLLCWYYLLLCGQCVWTIIIV